MKKLPIAEARIPDDLRDDHTDYIGRDAHGNTRPIYYYPANKQWKSHAFGDPVWIYFIDLDVVELYYENDGKVLR